MPATPSDPPGWFKLLFAAGGCGLVAASLLTWLLVVVVLVLAVYRLWGG